MCDGPTKIPPIKAVKISALNTIPYNKLNNIITGIEAIRPQKTLLGKVCVRGVLTGTCPRLVKTSLCPL